MYLPFIKPATGKTRRQVVRFGGLDRTQGAQEGTLADSLGLSSREWPCLGQRLGRVRTMTSTPSYTGLFAWDKLVTVDQAGGLSYGGRHVGKLEPGKKQFAVVNTKLCIFPDKKFLDMEDLELRDMAVRTKTVGHSVRFGEDTLEVLSRNSVLSTYESMQRNIPKNGTFRVYDEDKLDWDPVRGWTTGGYTEKYIHKLEPGDCLMLPRGVSGPTDRWPDCSWQNNTGDGYVNVPDQWGDYVYVKAILQRAYDSEGVGVLRLEMERRNAYGHNQSFLDSDLTAGDTVTISGCEDLGENNVDIRIKAIDESCITFDSPVLTPGDETGAVTLERRVPDLDFICESDNRLIGVSNKDKTVYISALGDPRNFYDYRGLSVSSSYIPVGSAGDFTGCVAYGGAVLIWKEDCLHRLMGNYDGNYTLYTDQVAGLQAGSGGSMVILNEVLYYKGREGVYAYTGATPRLISTALGDVPYRNAVAGTDGQRYYISMERTDTEVWELLVYDPQTGLWYREEDRQAVAFARRGGELWMLSEGAVYALGRGEDDDGTPIAWEATFNPFDETVIRGKYPSKLILRLELGEGAWVEAELARDGGVFEHVWTGHGSATTVTIPIRPGRCDRYQLRLNGEGRCLVRAMEREFAWGGGR